MSLQEPPTTVFALYQSTLNNNLSTHIASLDPTILSSRPLSSPEQDTTLDAITSNLPDLPASATELKRSIISAAFSTIISQLSTRSGPLSNKAHLLLYRLLDISLAFVQREWAPPELTLSCIEEVLETATVEEAEVVFAYLESRVKTLTLGMLPDRGKGLIFLRMQNNLLRRLSKSLHTVFCGRILCFLSSVFPIAEKSGVNLRGAFNSGNLTCFEEPDPGSPGRVVAAEDVEMVAEKETKSVSADGKPDERDSSKVKALKSATDKREFYVKFWSLQTLLSNPPELFKAWHADANPMPPGSDPNAVQPSTANLRKLKEGIAKTLEVFGRMTKKELELGASQQMHKNMDENEDCFEQCFFPKFLTKSNLLDLEIADPYFRRQVLTQFLIILQYIRGFSPEERHKRASLPKSNRVSEIPYIYQARDEAWVLKLSGEVWKTLYATPPNGETFAMTIQQILIRESSWIMWKAGSCASFEKPSLEADGSPGFKRITASPMRFPHAVGTPALSKLWQTKVSLEAMDEIELSKGVPDLKTLHLKIEQLDQQLTQLKQGPTAEDEPSKVMSQTLKDQIQQLEERKAGLSWRALRIAQSTYLQLFGKIGMPAKVGRLMSKIEELRTRGSGVVSRAQPGSQMSPASSGPVVLAGSPAGATDGRAEEGGRTGEGCPPDIVMLDGECIAEGGPEKMGELDGELIAEQQPGKTGPPSPPTPVTVQTQASLETSKISEIDQVIRRMEAEADRSAAATPPPTSGGPSGRHPNEYRGHHHPSMHYYHPSLPNHPHHRMSHIANQQSQQSGAGQKRGVGEVVEIDEENGGGNGGVAGGDVKKKKT